MAEVTVPEAAQPERVDVCTVCQFVWFDGGEYESLPALPGKPCSVPTLPQEARERIALVEIDSIREKARGGDWGGDSPDEWWKWLPGLFGFPVEYETGSLRQKPWLTWIFSIVIAVVSVAAFFNLETVVGRFGLVPARAARYGGLTLLTSFFLHGGVMHLLGNLYFFLVFGDNVEEWLGRTRFFLLLAFASIAGDVAHVLGDSRSMMPCIGASGGISGIMTFYALTFPRARVGFLVRWYFWVRWLRMPAYAMLLIWAGIQFLGALAQVAGYSNVSSLAHLGGAGVGFLFWLATRRRG